MDKYIITDFGYSPELIDQQNGEKLQLDRYGVWICSGDIAKDVVETSNDIEYLKTKYNTDKVVSLKNENSRLRKNIEG